MRVFAAAVTVLFSLIMVYGLQHFSAIESSYRVEAEKQVRDQLREENRQLRLAEAQLTQPGRIDGKARQLGLAAAGSPGRWCTPVLILMRAAPSLAQVTVPARRYNKRLDTRNASRSYFAMQATGPRQLAFAKPFRAPSLSG